METYSQCNYLSFLNQKNNNNNNNNKEITKKYF